MEVPRHSISFSRRNRWTVRVDVHQAEPEDVRDLILGHRILKAPPRRRSSGDEPRPEFQQQVPQSFVSVEAAEAERLRREQLVFAREHSHHRGDEAGRMVEQISKCPLVEPRQLDVGERRGSCDACEDFRIMQAEEVAGNGDPENCPPTIREMMMTDTPPRSDDRKPAQCAIFRRRCPDLRRRTTFPTASYTGARCLGRTSCRMR